MCWSWPHSILDIKKYSGEISEINPVKIQIRIDEDLGHIVWHTDPGQPKLPPMVNVYFNWDREQKKNTFRPICSASKQHD